MPRPGRARHARCWRLVLRLALALLHPLRSFGAVSGAHLWTKNLYVLDAAGSANASVSTTETNPLAFSATGESSFLVSGEGNLELGVVPSPKTFQGNEIFALRWSP